MLGRRGLWEITRIMAPGEAYTSDYVYGIASSVANASTPPAGLKRWTAAPGPSGTSGMISTSLAVALAGDSGESLLVHSPVLIEN